MCNSPVRSVRFFASSSTWRLFGLLYFEAFLSLSLSFAVVLLCFLFLSLFFALFAESILLSAVCSREKREWNKTGKEGRTKPTRASALPNWIRDTIRDTDRDEEHGFRASCFHRKEEAPFFPRISWLGEKLRTSSRCPRTWKEQILFTSAVSLSVACTVQVQKKLVSGEFSFSRDFQPGSYFLVQLRSFQLISPAAAHSTRPRLTSDGLCLLLLMITAL